MQRNQAWPTTTIKTQWQEIQPFRSRLIRGQTCQNGKLQFFLLFTLLCLAYWPSVVYY